MKKSFLCIATLLCGLTLFSQSPKMSPYTNNFISGYKMQKGKSLNKIYGIKTINQADYISAYIYLSPEAIIENLEAEGVIVDADFGRIISVKLPVSCLEKVAALNDVERIEMGTPVYTKMSNARLGANVDKVYSGEAPLSMPFRGKDVVIGIIDYGFQYDHITFFDAETRSDLRIKRVWNQNATGGTPPVGFSGGREYKTQEEILAAKYDDSMDDIGHGTHVAGIATGAFTGNVYRGVAPEADVVLVSYKMDDSSSSNVSISNGIKYIYDYATSVNKPCVVNMSLGMHLGPHDGTSTFDVVCDQMQGEGKLLIGSAGNEGADKVHVEKTLAEGDSLKTFVSFYEPSVRYGMIDIWGEADKTFTVRCVVFKKSTGEEIWSTGDLRATVKRTSSFDITSGAEGRIWVSRERNANNQKGNVVVTIQLSSLTSGNYFGIVTGGNEGSVHIWADDQYSYLASNNIAGWMAGNSSCSVGEIGGTGKRIISVGAWVTNTRYGQSKGQLASFSSRGPTADGRIKPEITAPGKVLASSVPNLPAVVQGMDEATNTSINGVKYYWAYMQGTSMSSPFVTGVLATWLQADKNLTPERVRDVLATTSIKDTHTGTVPNNLWGAGKIDAFNGLLEVIRQTPIEHTYTYPEKLLLYPTVTDGYCEVLCTQSDENMVMTVYNLNGQMVYRKNVGKVFAKETLTMDLSGLAEGVYMVKINGNTLSETKRILLQK